MTAQHNELNLGLMTRIQHRRVTRLMRDGWALKGYMNTKNEFTTIMDIEECIIRERAQSPMRKFSPAAIEPDAQLAFIADTGLRERVRCLLGQGWTLDSVDMGGQVAVVAKKHVLVRLTTRGEIDVAADGELLT